MFIFQTLSVLLMVTTCTISRGPHHPRGQAIVKHHVHYRPSRNEEGHDKITQDAQLLHDKEHIREDLGEWAQEKDLDQMSDEELEFHYFHLHDSDKNSQLDGLEILQAIRHTIEHDDTPDDQEEVEPVDFNFFVEMIDEVLLEDDTDADGFLSYPEYVAAKRKDVQSKVINEILMGPKIS